MNVQRLAEIGSWQWPADAGNTIKQALKDRGRSEADRLVAAELAGDLVVMNDDLAEAVLSVVANAAESVPLRAQSALSLGPVLEQTDIEGFDEGLSDPPISETTFESIQTQLHKLYLDAGDAKEVRRRVLEASVRAPQDWHSDALREAYASGDREWVLTAVFAMRWVQGFEKEIVSALQNKDPEIHFEAVSAAGQWSLDAAWPHVVKLVENPTTEKSLLLAAIEAVAGIRPKKAYEVLEPLENSDDPEIVEAVEDALGMASVENEEEDDEDWAG